MFKYFSNTYINTIYDDALLLRSQMNDITLFNDIVVFYNTFYNRLVVDFDNDSTYFDVKYKSIVLSNLTNIHKKVQEQTYSIFYNNQFSDADKRQNIIMIIDSFCFV